MTCRRAGVRRMLVAHRERFPTLSGPKMRRGDDGEIADDVHQHTEGCGDTGEEVTGGHRARTLMMRVRSSVNPEVVTMRHVNR